MSGQSYNTSIFSKKIATAFAQVGAGVRKHQQALSDKYGIPTFDVNGRLSTIPTDLRFSNIFEGFGAYGDAASFKQAVVDKVSQNPSQYNVTIQNNPNGQSSISIADPTQPQRFFNVNDPTKPMIETTGSSGISTFLTNNKLLLLGGGALLVLLMVGGRR